VAIKNLIDSYSSELEVINLTIQSADEKINEIKKMILQTPYLTDE
jgi:hypothetical protein